MRYHLETPQYGQKHYYAFYQQNNNVWYDVYYLNCSWHIFAVIVFALHCNTCSMGRALISSIFLLSQLSERWPNIMEPHNWKIICIQCIFSGQLFATEFRPRYLGTSWLFWGIWNGKLSSSSDRKGKGQRVWPWTSHIYLANIAWFFVETAYKHSPPEIQIEPQNVGESKCCRLRTPGAL